RMAGNADLRGDLLSLRGVGLCCSLRDREARQQGRAHDERRCALHFLGPPGVSPIEARNSIRIFRCSAPAGSPAPPMQSDSDRLFARATFLSSAGTPQEFPADGVPEIAFAGRSNVGKSSAINALSGRRRLAFASKAPGRTQTVNFYDLGGTARLVDLPGYGYARVSKSLRGAWDRLISDYFAASRSVIGVVVLMDARHPMSAQDERLVDWLRPFEFRQN